LSSIISVHVWFKVSSNKQKPNKHYIVPVFSYITVEFSHHQKGDNHTTKHLLKQIKIPYGILTPGSIFKGFKIPYDTRLRASGLAWRLTYYLFSSNKQKPNKHYIVPVFSYITVEFSHHQKGDNHTTKHTKWNIYVLPKTHSKTYLKNIPKYFKNTLKIF
jgi:hypothetical protein